MDIMNDDIFIVPHDNNIEKLVLGNLLVYEESIEKAVEIMTEKCFYRPFNRHIYESIVEMHKQGKPIDFITVNEFMKSQNLVKDIDQEMYVNELPMEGFAPNIKYLMNLLRKKAVLREILTLARVVEKKCIAPGADDEDIINEIENQITEIADSNPNREFEALRPIIDRVMENITKLDEAGKFPGLDTGFSLLNWMLGGFTNGEMITIGGKPGHGKTALALDLVRNISKDVPVGIFSLEMSLEQMTARMMQSESLFNMANIGKIAKDGKHVVTADDWKKLNDGCARLYNREIYLYASGGMRNDEFISKTKRMYREKGVRFFVVDYLQLMFGEGDNRTQEVSSISRVLKATAMNLKVPVLAVSQFSRKTEGKKGPPQLSDLRESGQIEQDSSVVLMLYNRHEETEKPHNYKKGFGEKINDGIRELLIRKNRNGPLGTVYMYWDADHTRFYCVDNHFTEQHRM